MREAKKRTKVTNSSLALSLWCVWQEIFAVIVHCVGELLIGFLRQSFCPTFLFSSRFWKYLFRYGSIVWMLLLRKHSIFKSDKGILYRILYWNILCKTCTVHPIYNLVKNVSLFFSSSGVFSTYKRERIWPALTTLENKCD